MSLSAYTKTLWTNRGAPAINKTNLAKIETGIYDLTEDNITVTNDAEATVTAEITSLASTILEAPLDTAYLRGRTVANMLGDAGDFEATTGWTATNCTIATNTSNEIFASNALKITLTDVAGTVDFDIFSRLKTGSYYLLSAYIKNGDATNINLEFESDDADVVTSDITATIYNRVGLVVQPSDFNTASTALFRLNVTGTTTKFAYVEGAMIVEITSAEYALGATALLAKYPYHNDIAGSDYQIVTSSGKNLVKNGNGENVLIGWQKSPSYTINNFYWDGTYFVMDDGLVGSGIIVAETPIKVKANTDYKLSFNAIKTASNASVYWGIDKTNVGMTSIGNIATGTNSFTVNFGSITEIYLQFFGSGGTTKIQFNEIQLELGTTATTYESFKLTSTVAPVVLNSVSDTVGDTYGLLDGLHNKNVSDVVELNGNDYTWAYYGGDVAEYKIIRSSILPAGTFVANSEKVYKYDNKSITNNPAAPSGDYSTLNIDTYIYITVFDTDTGFPDAWVSGTSFTAMTWNGLIKSYMNGWKLTTADVDVANCEWTGIVSGATKTAGAGYADTTTTIDAGFQPYRMYYQLATPIQTKYPSNVLNAYPSGTFLVESAVVDKAMYTTLITPTNVATKPIGNLRYVNKIEIDEQTKIITGITPISLSTCTVATLGVSFTSTALASGDYVEYAYNTIGISSTPSFTYTTAASSKSVDNTTTQAVKLLDEKIEELDTRTETVATVLNKKEWQYIDSDTLTSTATSISISGLPAYDEYYLEFVGAPDVSEYLQWTVNAITDADYATSIIERITNSDPTGIGFQNVNNMIFRYGATEFVASTINAYQMKFKKIGTVVLVDGIISNINGSTYPKTRIVQGVLNQDITITSIELSLTTNNIASGSTWKIFGRNDPV